MKKAEYCELLKYRKPYDYDIKSKTVQRLLEQDFVAGFEYKSDSDDTSLQVTLIPKTLKITEKGETALKEYNDVRQRKTRAKRKKAIKVGYDLLLLLVGAIISFGVQNASAILKWVSELFEN